MLCQCLARRFKSHDFTVRRTKFPYRYRKPFVCHLVLDFLLVWLLNARNPVEIKTHFAAFHNEFVSILHRLNPFNNGSFQ